MSIIVKFYIRESESHVYAKLGAALHASWLRQLLLQWCLAPFKLTRGLDTTGGPERKLNSTCSRSVLLYFIFVGGVVMHAHLQVWIDFGCTVHDPIDLLRTITTTLVILLSLRQSWQNWSPTGRTKPTLWSLCLCQHGSMEHRQPKPPKTAWI